jgi:hypothetical protein
MTMFAIIFYMTIWYVILLYDYVSYNMSHENILRHFAI